MNLTRRRVLKGAAATVAAAGLPVHAWAQADPIKIGVALQLLKVTDLRMRHYYLDAAIRGGATVTVVSGWVMDWQQQQRALSGDSATPAPAAAPGAVPNVDYFRCYVCGRNDNVHTMQPINVHSHCQLAVLDQLLAAYRGDK